MKRTLQTTLCIAIAAFTQIASAQTPAKFTSPFAFRTPSGLMPAGKYEVQVNTNNSPTVVLRHLDTRKGNLFVMSRDVATTELPRVDFSCVNGDDCQLRQITIRGTRFNAATHKARPNEKFFSFLLGSATKSTGD